MTSTLKTRSNNKVICLVGPSGTGKSVIANSIPLPKVVSYRTRGLREGEVDGIDGHFISRSDFLLMDGKELWIAETEYAGSYYGITQGELIELEDKPMIYVIDWPGVFTLKETFKNLEGYDPDEIVSIFIHTPREDLKARMTHQRRDKEEIKVRIDRADRDYASSVHCDHVVLNANGELDKTISEVMKIILKESF
jgi:guanylate kinase